MVVKETWPPLFFLEKKMTIRELIEILEEFEDDNKDVFIALFKNSGVSECFNIEEVADNNGHAQLGIIEEDIDYNTLGRPKEYLN